MSSELPSLIDPGLWSLVDESRAFYSGRASGRGPRNREELLAFRARAAEPAPCHPHPIAELASALGRTVPVRIHMPVRTRAAGVLLEIHGGGFYMGSAAGSDVRNRRLADALGVAVVSVDYRLAPEDPWPSAPEDCETAALWLVEQAGARFGTGKLAISGFSAGATLAVSTLVRLRDRGIPAFRGGVLQFGTYDLAAKTQAGRLIADEYFLEAYAGATPDRTHPDLSPLFADLAGLPPILIVIGTDDILLEDNLAMATRLSDAGVEVDLRIYPASPHGFTGHATPMARAALGHIDAWLRTQLGPAG
ncbi:alpha/beta hydrolase [Arthrobacter bambusae]|uniref:alpha/beta hydrolase n=1 Tax=Arthrobacter bambusae TaxID=1338426 RepID=UPI00278015F0|nr:alpha/beta hydrolase [Arthrobacter bambusae]MDQ0029031.1 acetyl esterase/lipase [Arthrobacter bambusae]MDQ0098567.1 acetyl esterase/lipase [Arthrobacter bambusae]